MKTVPRAMSMLSDDPTSIEVRRDNSEDVKVKLHGIGMPDRLEEERRPRAHENLRQYHYYADQVVVALLRRQSSSYIGNLFGNA